MVSPSGGGTCVRCSAHLLMEGRPRFTEIVESLQPVALIGLSSVDIADAF